MSKNSPFAPLDLDGVDDSADFAQQLGAVAIRSNPTVELDGAEKSRLAALSTAAGFPATRPAPKAKFEVRGRRKRILTGRSHTFSVKLRPADAQRIYDLVESLGADTVADVIEAAIDALIAQKNIKI
jgi:hypothetical protein